MVYLGKGLGAIKEANENSTVTLRLKDGESTVIRIITPLDEVISIYEHTEKFGGRWKNVRCLGKDECPLCKAGKTASFKSYFVVYDHKDKKVKIFKASKRVGKTILGLFEEYGDLTKRDFKILRQGEGTNTDYQFFARDPEPFNADELNIPDIEGIIEPLSAEEIVNLMQQKVSDVQPTDPGADNDFPF